MHCEVSTLFKVYHQQNKYVEKFFTEYILVTGGLADTVTVIIAVHFKKQESLYLLSNYKASLK